MIKLNFTPKIIFFDIDDTLSRNGILAQNNRKMLHELAKTSVKIVIATGRPIPILPQDILDLYENGVIDAIICTNGQYSFDKKGVISHYPLTKIQSSQIVELCKSKNVIFKFDSSKNIAFSQNVSNESRIMDVIHKDAKLLIDPDFHKNNDVYQSSVFFKDETYKMDEVNFSELNLKLVHWHSFGADILPIDASKARAVKDMCAYFGLDIKDTVAFGDGMNDIEMFDLVGFAVAMGDCREPLRKHANHVAGTIEEDGITIALQQIGVID